jgi:cytochrome b subunit of formate dehydrogenase
MTAVADIQSMFTTVTITAIAVVFGGTILHFLFARPKSDDLFGKDRSLGGLDLIRLIIFPFTLLFVGQKLAPAGVLRKLVFLLGLFCFVILVITGFVPRLFLDRAIYGYWLMVHATVAPVFSVCVACLAVMWGHNCRLDKNYCPWLNTIFRRQPKSTTSPEKYELCRKVCFWLIICLSLPVILSAVVAMFPLFGTHWQELLGQIHRYCTLALALLVIIYLHLSVMAEMWKVSISNNQHV